MSDTRPRARPRKSRMREWFAGIGLALCLTAVLFATMWPAPLDQVYTFTVTQLLDVLHKYGVPLWFGYTKLEFSANVVMFAPLAFLLTLTQPTRRWWLALVLCPALSGAIELTQAIFLDARFATLTDVLANSIGALLGVVLAVAARAVVHARDEKVVARALWQHARGR
jgi:glycopeptide antibiotics resistance protein